MKLVIDLSALLLFGLIWLGAAVFLRRRKKKSFVYLIFFTIFCVYIFKVFDYTLFQFQSLLLLKHFMPNLIVNGQTTEASINLIPLVTLAARDLKTSLLNILLLIPFGFGLPFITNFRLKQTILAAALFSLSIELMQLGTGLMAQTTFRVADVNDLIFNTLGAAVGYLLFVGFMRLYRLAFRKSEKPANPLLRYVAERPQLDE